jgi:xylan 1,4-beta-xylosidase
VPAGLAATRSNPLTGNFTWRDDFSTPELSLLWITLRAPHTPAWTIDPVHGLRLTPGADSLSGTGHPAFLARRLQHAKFDASTRLSVPVEPGISAGLVIFQSETHNFFLGVRRTPEASAIFLEELNGKAPAVVATAAIPATTSELELKVTGNEKTLSFSYATEPGSWKILAGDADATVITTQVAGGFVGAVIGLHARIDPK